MKMAPKCEATCAAFLRTTCSAEYDYDLIVIGGGSGGLSAAKEATALGAKVAVLDYSTPTPLGTTWGMGGTCVNVGCIPKKLMHQAALLGEALDECRSYGWQVEEKTRHNWKDLINAIQKQIKSINWEIQLEIADMKIHHIHGSGSFKDPHTIRVVTHDGEKQLTAKYILIAIGTRPKYPDIPGAQEYGITSDDLFSLDKPPGKTLIVGAGYIGMESAGSLRGLGYDVTVMNRTSVVLRRFDQQIAKLLLCEMEDKGVKFLHKCQTKSIAKSTCARKLNVTWQNDENEEFTDCFDTVLFAIGRRAPTKELNLENAGVELARDGEKIDAINEQTNVPHIYAVGDVLYGKPELTPIAIQAGKLLARRLFGNSKITMDYDLFATTVFTPLEYGVAGISEEAALSQYGEDNIEVYHAYYKPATFFLPQKNMSHCYLKVIALRGGGQQILGVHFTGLDAGEVAQGFLTALKCGLTVDDLFIKTIGVHTTNAEEFTKLTITKRSGEDPSPPACCS